MILSSSIILRRSATLFILATILFPSFTPSPANADSYCGAQYQLDSAALPSQLQIYHTLSNDGRISAAAWQDAEAVYQRSFEHFRPISMNQYCDDNAKAQNGLIYVLNTLDRYLYRNDDPKWAANWLEILEPYVGRGSLTLGLYRSLLVTTLRGLQASHEQVSADFEALASKYGASP